MASPGHKSLPTRARDLAIAEGDLARAVRRVEGDGVALAGLRRARDLLEDLVAQHPLPTRTRDLAIAERSLARLVGEIEGDAAALAGLRRARDLFEGLAAEDP